MFSLVMLVVAQVGEFQRLEEVNGVRVEARALPPSPFAELRLTSTSSASLDALCDEAFGDGTVPRDDAWVRERRVLSEASDERVTYERVRAPIVSDRDYVLRTWRTRVAGQCRVQFHVVAGVVPPKEGLVRLTVLRGAWRFEARGEETAIEYVSHSEPGGGMPAFLVEGPRRATELEVVRRLIARAERRAEGRTTRTQ
jgi:hypothetical protein